MSDITQAKVPANPERVFVVGLTGGIASGKTTVSDAFGDLGIDVVDADVVAREVVEPGKPVLAQLASLFGEHIINPDGTLNRKTMRTKMFADSELRGAAEQLLHPAIRERMWQQVAAATSAYCLLVIPLLLETGGHTKVDRVLVVDVDQPTQIKRLMARDNSSMEEVKAILAAQSSREQRLSIADDVINNSGDRDRLAGQVAELHQQYLKLAALPHG